MPAFSCLFVGRFQPFHNGHLMVIKGMSKVCGKIIVAIGSPEAQESGENPFTALERREMIQRALQGESIIPNFDVSIIEVPDVGDDEAWTKKCLELAETVHQAWTGNEWTKTCFEKAGVEVKAIKEVPGVSATEVRRRMKEGGDWKELVPAEVASYLVELNATERVKKL